MCGRRGSGGCRCGAARAEVRRVRAGCRAPRSAVSRRSRRGTGGSPQAAAVHRSSGNRGVGSAGSWKTADLALFFCLAFSAESNSGRFVLCSAFFFFFSCCAGLFRFSSSFPHVCRFRASGGPVGYDPAPEERSPWDSGAGAPLPRVLSAVGARRDSGGSGRHRSACGTAVPSGLPVFFPVAAAQQHSSTPLSCTDNFPPRARVTRQRFISLFSPPIPCE